MVSLGNFRLSSAWSGSFRLPHQLGMWRGALCIAIPRWEGSPQLGSVPTACREKLSWDARLFSFSSLFGHGLPRGFFSFSCTGLIGNVTESVAGPGVWCLWGALPRDRTTLAGSRLGAQEPVEHQGVVKVGPTACTLPGCSSHPSCKQWSSCPLFALRSQWPRGLRSKGHPCLRSREPGLLGRRAGRLCGGRS